MSFDDLLNYGATDLEKANYTKRQNGNTIVTKKGKQALSFMTKSTAQEPTTTTPGAIREQGSMATAQAVSGLRKSSGDTVGAPLVSYSTSSDDACSDFLSKSDSFYEGDEAPVLDHSGHRLNFDGVVR